MSSSPAIRPDFDEIARKISPEELAKAIGAKEGRGKEYHCPNAAGHSNGDGKASLSICRSNGRTVAHCHGCGLSGSPVQVAAAVLGLSEDEAGVKLASWTGLKPPGTPLATGKGIVETYDYTDQEGNLLFQVVRFEPKDFRQRRKDDRGEWEWKLGDTRRVPYHLTQLIEGVGLDKTIYVVEGEKDVHAMEAAGAVATCNPGGAGKWKDEYTTFFQDAKVVIVADNDEPGRKHAQQVFKALEGVAAEVQIVQAREGKDASDHLAAGHGLDSFVPMREDEEPGLPAPVRLLDAGEAEPPKFLIQDVLLEADLNLLASDGGAGKTVSALHLCGCVIHGSPAFQNPAFSVEGTGPVLYVSEEDSLGVIKNRMEALARGQEWNVAGTLGNFFCLAREGTSLDSLEWQAHLLRVVEESGIKLVVFDPYAELTLADENSNSENKPIVRFFRRITNETGATVVIVHHLAKAVEGKRKIDRIRGFSGLRDACRVVFLLEEAPAGTSFECLKLSRSDLPPKFVVKRVVEADPANPASWLSASLTYLEETAADGQAAERFVIRMLEDSGELNTSEIKKLAVGTGVSAVAVSGAISRLESLGRIAFRAGEKNSKRWSLSRLPEDPGQASNQGLPDCQTVARQSAEPAPSGCPNPMGRATRELALLTAGQAGKEEEWHR